MPSGHKPNSDPKAAAFDVLQSVIEKAESEGKNGAEGWQGTGGTPHTGSASGERSESGAGVTMRRFTRLTNGFSKTQENHAHALALHFMHYNFARIHKSLRITQRWRRASAPHVWGIEEIVGLLDVADKKAAKA